jgi:hypothetical protein
LFNVYFEDWDYTRKSLRFLERIDIPCHKMDHGHGAKYFLVWNQDIDIHKLSRIENTWINTKVWSQNLVSNLNRKKCIMFNYWKNIDYLIIFLYNYSILFSFYHSSILWVIKLYDQTLVTIQVSLTYDQSHYLVTQCFGCYMRDFSF